MPEEATIAFRLEQHPVFDLDANDPGAVRRWRTRCIEDEVMLAGHLPSRMVLVGTGVQRVGSLTPTLEPKEDLKHAALFRLCAGQPEVVRAYREGEITVEEHGARYRAAALVEWDHRTGRWWAAQRRIGTNAVSVGVFHGDWLVREGDGLDTLGEPLRSWVDTEGVELGASDFTYTPKNEPMPDLLYTTHTLNRLPPPDPMAYADIVGELRDREVQTKLPAGFEILAFRGTEVEHYILGSALSLPMDDFVRAIAQRGPAEAVALRFLGVATVDGESFRAVLCTVECAGRVHDRALALRFGPDGRVTGVRVLHQERGPVPEGGLWLGVPPKHAEIDLFLLGPQGPVPEG